MEIRDRRRTMRTLSICPNLLELRPKIYDFHRAIVAPNIERGVSFRRESPPTAEIGNGARRNRQLIVGRSPVCGSGVLSSCSAGNAHLSAAGLQMQFTRMAG